MRAGLWLSPRKLLPGIQIDLSHIDLDYKSAFAPENFLFGVAYAPFLSEGGCNYPDGIKNNLAELELNGMIEKSGEAARFWTNYKEHFKLAASLGLNAFRMGVDWARVQPTTSLKPHDPPEWDWEAVDHYAEMIATMIRYGMEPIITLHHFTHPAWLKGDMWTDDYGPALFVDYAVRVVKEINERLLDKVNRVIKIFVVSNEANLFPLANLLITSEFNSIRATRRAYDNVFLSIAKIYDELYSLYEDRDWGTPTVSYNVASSCFYEQDKMFFDILRLREFGIVINLWNSDGDEKMADTPAKALLDGGRFPESVPRISEIEEYEAPLCCLFNEYPEV